MIHTVVFSTVPMFEDIEYIFDNFKTVRDKSNRIIYVRKYKDLNMRYDREYGVLLVTVNLNNLINKNTINNFDYFQVMEEYKSQFCKMFQYTSLGVLNRIDYKKDICTENKDVYIKLFKKATKGYKTLKQNNTYSTSVYYNSKSVNINIYDKEEEVKNKNTDIVYVNEYRDVIRIEIQLKRNALYYLEKELGVIRELGNYFTEIDRNYFLNKYLRKIIYQGDYYSLKKSREILENEYSESMTNKLIEFQKLISKKGISNVKAMYNDSTFNNYIKRLEKVNVNPIVIPKHDRIEYLPNLLNFIQEEKDSMNIHNYDIKIEDGKLYNYGMLLVETENNDQLMSLLNEIQTENEYFRNILNEINKIKHLKIA